MEQPEHAVTISGCCAEWTLIMRAGPPEDHEEPLDVHSWPNGYFAAVAEHFVQAVNHYELARSYEDDTGCTGLT